MLIWKASSDLQYGNDTKSLEKSYKLNCHEQLIEHTSLTPVAKALGQKLAAFIYGLARSVSTKPGSDGMGRTRKKKYQADVEFIDAHSNILPKLISTGIDTSERREVVKRLQCWHQVAQSRYDRWLSILFVLTSEVKKCCYFPNICGLFTKTRRKIDSLIQY